MERSKRLTFEDPAHADRVEANLREAGHAVSRSAETPGVLQRLFGAARVVHLDFDDAHARLLLDHADRLGLTAEVLCGPGVRARLDEALAEEQRRIHERRGGFLDLHDHLDRSLLLDEATLFRTLVGTPVTEQVGLLRDWVSGRRTLATEPRIEPRAELLDPSRLRAGFLPAERVERARAALPSGKREAEFVTFPSGVEGLLLVPVIDTGDHLLSMVGDSLDELGLEAEEALVLGLEQLAALPVPNGVLTYVTPDVAFGVLTSDDGFAAVRVLFDGVRQALEAALGGRALYAIPHRDVLYAARADIPKARLALWAHARGEHASAEHPLVPCLVRIGADGLEQVPDAEVMAAT